MIRRLALPAALALGLAAGLPALAQAPAADPAVPAAGSGAAPSNVAPEAPGTVAAPASGAASPDAPAAPSAAPGAAPAAPATGDGAATGPAAASGAGTAVPGASDGATANAPGPGAAAPPTAGSADHPVAPNSPERQAPVPEVGAGRGAPGSPGTNNAQQPQAAPIVPSGTPAAPNPYGPGQTPVAPQPERPPQPTTLGNQPLRQPFTDRGQADAAEQELRAALRGDRIQGRISIPDGKAASLVQPEGRDWRYFRNVILPWVGGVAVVGMFALLALFLLVRGRIRPEHGMSGRKMGRFNAIERANHWMVAASFVVLALSGLNLTFGGWVIRPVIGPEAFTALSEAGKTAHNFLGLPFTVGVLVMFVLWVRDNIPNKLDWDWIKKGGGFIGRGHPAAKRFNFGQKMVFWITVLGGGLVAVSGYFLIFPFYALDIQGQQWAYIAHATLSVLMIAAMLAHIYIGSVGMEGAVEAMSQGVVDYNWAREHHSLWVEEELAKAHAVVGPPPGAPPGARIAGAD
ncbi:formate dehydrogenase subunit gamma [Roseomonas sp. BN140053]|uniref:formate dehydrogenase subunit gamma n=1 Tax=Roseomonas sp. BN140053 TaxID=3391898 RepID=UPI0039E78588